METTDKKKLEKLQKEKKDAERKKKYTEVSELCNLIGEIYRKSGFLKKAIEAYSEDLTICETYNDILGVAVACRMLSECYCDLLDFSKAIHLQKRYLLLARSINNTVEEQRAWATIGRTYLFQAETDEGRSAYTKAEEAFIQALELCESMKSNLSQKEYMLMKARLLLNMGVVQSGRKNFQEFKDYMQRCITIARANGLEEELFRCQFLLADHYSFVGNSSTGLQLIESAIKSALKMNNRHLLTDSYFLKYQICFENGQFGMARHSLKKLISVGFNDDRKLKKFYRIAQKCEIVWSKVKSLEKMPDKDGITFLMKQYELLADYSVDLSFDNHAIRYYLKVLEFGMKVNTAGCELVPIYMSLAQTYQDNGQYEKAIQYYQMELNNTENNPERCCQILINLAINQETMKMNYEVIKLSYLRALNFAREAEHLHLQHKVLNLLLEAQQTYKQDKDRRKSLEKLKELQSKLHVSVRDTGQTGADKIGDDGGGDGNDDDGSGGSGGEISSNSGIEDDHDHDDDDDDDVQISDLTESEDDDEEDQRETLPSRRSNCTRLKVKRNEKGETPLHRACIEGNLKRVELLIKQGQPVNVRDYCGWLPIHEAANLGYHYIVEYLMKHGADIDDVGGKECGHVTPLIDAAINGNIEVMRVLIDHGANISIKDSKERTALSYLMEWRENCDDVDVEAEMQYQWMVRHLQEKMGISDVTILHRTPDVRCNDNSDDNESPSMLSATSRRMTDRRRRRKQNENLSQFIEEDISTEGSSSDTEGHLDNNDSNSNIIEEESATAAYMNAMSSVRSSARHRLHNNDCNSNNNSNNNNNNNNNSNSSHKSLQRRRHKGGLNKSALISSERFIDSDWLVEDMQPSKRKRVAARGNYFTTGSAVRNNSDNKNKNISADSVAAAPAKPSSLSSYSKRLKSSSKQYSVVADDDHDDDDDDNDNDDDDYDDEERCGFDDSITGSNLPDPFISDIDLTNTTASSGTISSTATGQQWGSNRFSSSLISAPNHGAATPTPMFNWSSDLRLSDTADTLGSVQQQPSSSVYSSTFIPPPLSSSSSSSSSTTLPLRTDSVAYGTVHPFTKVFVKVGTLCFCVPLAPSDRSKTILWLNQETSRRVYVQCHLKPILSLTTKSGAILDSDDKISMVIENGEELEGCVTSWDLPPFKDRYIEACKANKTVAVEKINEKLDECEISGHLILPYMALTPNMVLPLFRAIKYQNNLGFINLTGNRLGDVGVQSLSEVLNTVPSVTSLNISCNGITLKGLKHLSSVLEASYGTSFTGQRQRQQQQHTVPWDMAKKPLQKLESLNLSYNHLTDECCGTLMVLLQHLPSLTHLAIASCQLSHTFFEQAYRLQPTLTSPAGHMAACYLQHVDISSNKLESSGIRLLFKWLDPTQLTSLDMSWTTTSSLTNQLVCNSLMNFLPLCEDPKLQSLSLVGCDLSLEDGDLLVRLPCFATRLQFLDLSSNPQFEQPFLLQLLENASSNVDCALEEITMIDCGICGPLTSDLLDSLVNKLSATIPVAKLHFSCEKLDAVDRNSLKQVWCGHWGDLAVCNFTGGGDIIQLSVRNGVF